MLLSSPLLWRGAAFFPSFGWLLVPCLLLGGAAWPPPPLGGVAFVGLGVWQMRRATRGVAGWVVTGWSGLGERLLPVLRVSLAESHANNADENTSGRRPYWLGEVDPQNGEVTVLQRETTTMGQRQQIGMQSQGTLRGGRARVPSARKAQTVSLLRTRRQVWSSGAMNQLFVDVT